MSLRIFKRMKLAPGVSLNLSKSGPSLSLGPRGAKVTVGRRGVRTTAGLPGTGIHYTKHTGWGGGRKVRAGASTPGGRAAEPEPGLGPSAEQRIELGFLRKLLTPDNEIILVEGLKEFARNNERGALEKLRLAVGLADGAFLAGFLALRQELTEEAERHLLRAYQSANELGTHFEKYGLHCELSLPITELTYARIGPNKRGALLGLVEVYQQQERLREAVTRLRELQQLDPRDLVTKVSLAEILTEADSATDEARQEVVRLAEGVGNDSELHAALLYYKAKALRRLRMPDAAAEVLTLLLRKKKDRSGDLLLAMRYERALAYEELGRAKRARGEFEKIFARAPDYGDVASRLGIA